MSDPAPAFPGCDVAPAASEAEARERLADVYTRMAGRGADPTWIHRVPERENQERLVQVMGRGAPPGPLAGVPFAIKDNIDLEGVPTTAACPEFSYTPTRSATVVERLLAAGALPVGKTNLDQFATGLVGVRSPYGVPVNPFHPDYIPGGSSSGSAVAVAAGLCAFSLGTDTAGSGRIPAMLNGLVGLKPTRGLLSTTGVVPACRSLDCVSIFARSCGDAAAVLQVAAGYDPDDPFSRVAAPPAAPLPWPPRIGIPRQDQLEFFGNEETGGLFERALAQWRRLGATLVEIDFTPFRETARLLYEGAWVAERYAAIRTFLDQKPEAVHPVTRGIIEGARRLSAADAFDSIHRLAALRRRAEVVWGEIDLLVTPTAGTLYRVSDVLADPLRTNSTLGTYTNFMNLLDLAGLAVPAGRFGCGVPFGITLVAPAFQDDRLLAWGARFLGEPPPRAALAPASAPVVRLAVCGAHLAGLPLNPQLVQRGARLVRAATTAPHYRLYALAGAEPRKPGLVRVQEAGASVAVEVWEMPLDQYGSFVAGIPAPLGIGRIALDDGEQVQGFVCEAHAVRGARDITAFGGWRAFLASGQ